MALNPLCANRSPLTVGICVTLYLRPVEVHPFHVFCHERAIRHHFRRRPSRNPDIPRTAAPGELVACDIYADPNTQPYSAWTEQFLSRELVCYRCGSEATTAQGVYPDVSLYCKTCWEARRDDGPVDEPEYRYDDSADRAETVNSDSGSITEWVGDYPR